MRLVARPGNQSASAVHTNVPAQHDDTDFYPDSAIGEIHRRIGAEIPRSQIKRVLDSLVADGTVRYQGEKRWRRYQVAA
jgi:hypothetical protein